MPSIHLESSTEADTSLGPGIEPASRLLPDALLLIARLQSFKQVQASLSRHREGGSGSVGGNISGAPAEKHNASGCRQDGRQLSEY